MRAEVPLGHLLVAASAVAQVHQGQAPVEDHGAVHGAGLSLVHIGLVVGVCVVRLAGQSGRQFRFQNHGCRQLCFAQGAGNFEEFMTVIGGGEVTRTLTAQCSRITRTQCKGHADEPHPGDHLVVVTHGDADVQFRCIHEFDREWVGRVGAQEHVETPLVHVDILGLGPKG